MRNKKTGIAIIEDHPVMREGLAAWFAGTGRWQVKGKASSLAGAKKLLTRPGFQTDLVLLDIQLEDGWGLDIIPWYMEHIQIAQQDPYPPVPLMAVYTVFDDYAHVNAALSMGVRAYICKRRNEREIEEVLLKTLGGGIYVDDTAETKLKNVTDLFSLLTKRETEILSLVKRGFSNKQIAACLGISRRTVENILSCVYDKTGIKSRLELERL